MILVVMAATSHDFWLHNLSPYFWKSLHMGVYVAYAALIGHVALGILQYEASPLRYGLIIAGVASVSGLHIAAGVMGRKERRDRKRSISDLVRVCRLEEIPKDRARIVIVAGQEIAIFRYDGKCSAIHNLCKHQNGPLGEGRIIDGCVTCPWHGYQYLPGNGQSPPPFTETVHTYRVVLKEGEVFVDPTPLPEGTPVPPAMIETRTS